jgi:hypothetical protein
MLELHKNILLDENEKPIAVQIPIEEFQRLEEIIEITVKHLLRQSKV